MRWGEAGCLGTTGVWVQPMAWQRVACALAGSRLNRVRGRGHWARPTLTLAGPICSKSPWTVILLGEGADFLLSLKPTFQMALSAIKQLPLQNTGVTQRKTVPP